MIKYILSIFKASKPTAKRTVINDIPELVDLGSGLHGTKWQKMSSRYFMAMEAQQNDKKGKDWKRFIDFGVIGLTEIYNLEKAMIGEWGKIGVDSIPALEVFDYLIATGRSEKAKDLFNQIKNNSPVIFNKFYADKAHIENRSGLIDDIIKYISNNRGCKQNGIKQALKTEVDIKQLFVVLERLGIVSRTKVGSTYTLELTENRYGL